MIVKPETDFKFLSIFGDGKSHNWFEIIYLGTIYLETRQAYTEKLLYRAVVDNGWVYRTGKGPSLKEDGLKLTKKGDEYYRFLAIRWNPTEQEYYKHFNRGIKNTGFAEYGLDKYAPLPKNIQKIK